MALTSYFRDAVRNQDIEMIRIMMKDSLVRDPSFSEFKDMSSEAVKNIGTETLYDIHDGEIFNSDKSDWNKGYLNHQMVNLMSNFSRERIEHLKKVCSFIYADEIKSRSDSTDNHPERHKHQQNGGNNSGFFILLAGLIAIFLLIMVIIRLIG